MESRKNTLVLDRVTRLSSFITTVVTLIIIISTKTAAVIHRIGLLPWPRVELIRPHSNEGVVSICRGGRARGACCYYKTASALSS